MSWKERKEGKVLVFCVLVVCGLKVEVEVDIEGDCVRDGCMNGWIL